jgi:V/A-type H+/Na+-transporting ATPase subunit E
MTEMDNVSKKVLDDAQNIRKENLKEAEEKAAQILSEAEGKIKDILKKGKEEAGQHYTRTYTLEVFKTRSGLEQKMLLKKIKLVDSIISEAKKKLSNLDKKGWQKFLVKSIASLGIKEGTYSIGSNEKILDGMLIESVSGLKPAVKGEELQDGLKVFDGKAEYDLTPEKYLDMDIEDLKMEIASYLFKQGE